MILPPLAMLGLAMTVPPPPPIASNGRMLLAWLPGEMRCGDRIVTATPARRPWSTLTYGAVANLHPVTYGFAIDASGRTSHIHRQDGTGYVPFGDDLEPALAATGFAKGAPQTACTVTLAPRQTPLAETPLPDLWSYTVTPLSGALPDDGWRRIRGGGTCLAQPRPEPLTLSYPDQRTVPATPGIKDWALVGYDLDAGGRPTAVRVVAGTGNASLDAAATKAMAASRFAVAGPKRGCLHPFTKAPATLEAPPLPPEETARTAGASCPSKHDWVTMPTLRFPEPYRRRSIEGWAIVTYDVAPWGEIGNLHVADAEPTEEFGTQALSVLRGAKVPTTQGLIGCVDRVRFRMASANDTTAAP